MTKQDRQKLSILIVLLAVLGLTIVLGYRMIRPPTAASVQPADVQKTSANPPAPSEAHIRLDLLEDSDAAKDIGTRNLFQYRQAPPPPSPAPPRGGPPSNLTASAPTGPVAPPPPPGPPPPPPIALKYQGYALTSTPSPELIAFIADDARHYNVKTGEILMGRFRIVSISEKTVEVEDLEYNRRQMLPMLK
jgi:hypothetical protein